MKFSALPKGKHAPDSTAAARVPWEIVSDGECIATVHCQWSKNSMGGLSMVHGSARKNALELCALANLAAVRAKQI